MISRLTIHGIFSVLIFSLVLLCLVACGPQSSLPPASQPTSTDRVQSAAGSMARSVASPTSTVEMELEKLTIAPTKSITPPAIQPPLPTATPASDEQTAPEFVSLYYEEYAQFELIAPSGTRVLIDVANPDALSSPPTDVDILLTTHHHFDHYLESFAAAFPGEQLNRTVGKIELPGVRIMGIPSAHNQGDRLRESGGTNYIYLVEMGGLRIAHLGDIGQEQLTSEQLQVLQPVDIAITQLTNPYSDMDMENIKGFRLMEQLSPRLVIPTHASRSALEYALGIWEGFRSQGQAVQISPEMLDQRLPDQRPLDQRPGLLLLGSHAENTGDRYPLSDW